MIRWFFLSVTVGLAGSLFSADAELVARDLFITIDSEPTAFDYTIEGPTGTRTGDDSFDSGFGLSAGLRWSFTPSGSPLGLVVGADLGATNYRYLDGAANFTTGARVVLGAGWAFTDRLELLLEPTVEYGLARFNFPATVSYPALKANGTFLGFGLRANLVWQMSDEWALMGALGWKQLTNDLTDGGLDIKLEQAGPCISLGFLYRFSNAPTRIE